MIIPCNRSQSCENAQDIQRLDRLYKTLEAQGAVDLSDYVTDDDLTNGLADALDGYSLNTHNHDVDYSPVSHNHNDDYYTIAEVDDLINAIQKPVVGEVKAVLWLNYIVPDGWAVAFGQAIDRTTPLGTILVQDGAPYGDGDGSTTVNLPDLRDRCLFGGRSGLLPGDPPDTILVHSVGGEASHELTISEMPEHSHLNYYSTQGKNWQIPSGTWHENAFGEAHGYNTFTGSAGEGASHNNLPPYVGVVFVVFVG